MRVKLFSYLIVGAMLACAASMFTSCKDNDGDLFAKLQDENLTLRNKMQQDFDLLNGKYNDLNALYLQLKAQADACQTNCAAAREALRNELMAKFGNYVTNDELQALLDGLLNADGVDQAIEDYLNNNGYSPAGPLTDEAKDEIKTMLNNYLKATDLDTKVDAKLLDYLKAADAAAIYVTKVEYNAHLTEFATLKGQVTNLETTVSNINNVLTQAAGNYTSIGARFSAIETALNDAQTTINNVQTAVNNLTTEVNNAKTKISTLEGKVGTLEGKVTTAEQNITKLTTDLSALTTKVNNLETALNALTPRVTAVEQKAEDAYKKAVANAAAIQILNKGHKDNYEAILKLQKELADYKAEAQAALQEILDKLGDDSRVSELADAIDALDKRLKAVEDKVDEIAEALEELEGRVENLENRVSSIELQMVYNPVTGALNLPVNLQSMILFNYYGESETTVKFPMFELEELGINYGSNTLPGEDVTALLGNAIEFVTVYEGQRLVRNHNGSYEGNMGKVYFTVNPSNIDLEGKTFALVNSLGEVCPVKLTDVRPSDKLLTFGSTRAASSNTGFYEAYATVQPDEVGEIAFKIEPAWKSTLKNALKNRNLGSLASVANMFLNQFDGKLPAYGLNVTWDEDGKPYGVTSKYGIAATTLKPLSFATFFGQDFSSHVPSLPNIDNILDQLHFNFNAPQISLGTQTINVKAPKFNMNLNLGNIKMNILLDKVSVEIEDYPVSGYIDGTEVKFVTEKRSFDADMTTVAKKINDEIDAQLKKIFDDLNVQINKEVEAQLNQAIEDMINDIQDAVNDLLKDMEAEINTQLENVIKDLQNSVNGKLDNITDKIANFYGKVESIYSRLTGVFSDPNHYLQGMMLYSGDGGSVFGRLSNSKAAPTIFTGTGTAVNLVPTSYTAELLAPAYKKFVAVTNVFDANGNSAKGGNAACTRLLQRANAGQYMNQVIDGDRKTVVFDFAGARGGNYTYEIFYQALDYSGHTTTQTFYVTIK